MKNIYTIGMCDFAYTPCLLRVISTQITNADEVHIPADVEMTSIVFCELSIARMLRKDIYQDNKPVDIFFGLQTQVKLF